MHAVRAPGACQQEMQFRKRDDPLETPKPETINPEPGTLLPTQVPVNEDGSFLAFGQGTSGTVTRAGTS